MKELSLIEKADAYDRVSKEVKDFFDGKTKMYSDVIKTLEYLFPELKESEDEKRVKNILSVLDAQMCWDGATGKKMNPYQKEIDWLKSLKVKFSPMNGSLKSDNVAKPNFNVSDLA